MDDSIVNRISHQTLHRAGEVAKLCIRRALERAMDGQELSLVLCRQLDRTGTAHLLVGSLHRPTKPQTDVEPFEPSGCNGPSHSESEQIQRQGGEACKRTRRLVRRGVVSQAASPEACRKTNRNSTFAALQSVVIRIFAFAVGAHFLCGFIPGKHLQAKADKASADALTRDEAASTNKRLTCGNSILEWRLLHRTTDCVLCLAVLSSCGHSGTSTLHGAIDEH